MRTSYKTAVEYFLSEGRDHLYDCLKISFDAALKHNISKLIIFTSRGEGPRIAIDEFLTKPEYEHVKITAVTFPQGKLFTGPDGKKITIEIPIENSEKFRASGVNILRAHLPFDPIEATFQTSGALGQDVSLIGEALSIFGGSMSLCVQAALMACDAGEISFGDHAISLTSDTSILVRVAPTRLLLRDFVVREIICKPAILTVGKKENPITTGDEALEPSEHVTPKALGEGT